MFTSKYEGVDFSDEVVIAEIQRLTNQLWKIIPMRENKENWQKQLNTVIIEIVGLSKIFIQIPQFLQLIAKLEGLQEMGEANDFEVYRKTVFECISLLQRLKNGTSY